MKLHLKGRNGGNITAAASAARVSLKSASCWRPDCVTCASVTLCVALQKPGGLMFPDRAALYVLAIEDRQYKDFKIHCE